MYLCTYIQYYDPLNCFQSGFYKSINKIALVFEIFGWWFNERKNNKTVTCTQFFFFKCILNPSVFSLTEVSNNEIIPVYIIVVLKLSAGKMVFIILKEILTDHRP